MYGPASGSRAVDWPIRSSPPDVTIWLDNQLPPALATWVRATLGVECTSIRELALQRATDLDIFRAARAAGAVVMTKDADFAAL